MIIRESLYTYGYSEKKRNKVIKKINRQAKVKDLHVIVLPLFDDGLLEIYPFDQLLQPFYKDMTDNIKIVGIAKGKDGATALVQDIIQQIYDSGCDFDVNKFFEM